MRKNYRRRERIGHSKQQGKESTMGSSKTLQNLKRGVGKIEDLSMFKWQKERAKSDSEWPRKSPTNPIYTQPKWADLGTRIRATMRARIRRPRDAHPGCARIYRIAPRVRSRRSKAMSRNSAAPHMSRGAASAQPARATSLRCELAPPTRGACAACPRCAGPMKERHVYCLLSCSHVYCGLSSSNYHV